MRFESVIKPETCPNCGSKNIATYVYGYPTDKFNYDRVKSGEVILGGCFYSNQFPAWKCNDCETKMYKPPKKHIDSDKSV